jgi:hypothetical protein
VELYLLKADGTYQNYVNIPDALYTANQTQILQWVQAQGFGYTTDAASDPDPNVQTLTNLTQVQNWIYSQVNEGTRATAPGATPSSSPAPSMNPWGIVALVAGVGVLGSLLWAALDAGPKRAPKSARAR